MHSSAAAVAAAAAQSDEARVLEPIAFIVNGAKVMLTPNLWPVVGLCNGAASTVVSILFAEGHHPPSLPIAVIARFNMYSGPSSSDYQLFCFRVVYW